MPAAESYESPCWGLLLLRTWPSPFPNRRRLPDTRNPPSDKTRPVPSSSVPLSYFPRSFLPQTYSNPLLGEPPSSRPPRRPVLLLRPCHLLSNTVPGIRPRSISA